jgi:hypothetical protein
MSRARVDQVQAHQEEINLKKADQRNAKFARKLE